MEIKEKKGLENLVANYLSRLELEVNEASQVHINNSFLDEQLLVFPMLINSMVCRHRELPSCRNYPFGFDFSTKEKVLC